jgi:riboflavin biosynthesis pyrimidine reductase
VEEEPPYHHPVFVLTHHPREPLVLEGTTFAFVTDGIESALEQAREAAAGRDVAVGGGAEIIQQYLRAGLLDELQVHVSPMLLEGHQAVRRGGPGRPGDPPDRGVPGRHPHPLPGGAPAGRGGSSGMSRSPSRGLD